MDDSQPPGSNPDPVIPPPPAASPGSFAASAPPLAPPLGAPPAGPPAAPPAGTHPWPAAPLPPYAAGYPAASGPTAPIGNGYPAAPYPSTPPATGGNRIGIALALVGGLLALILVGLAIVVGFLVSSPDEPSTAPGPTSVTEKPSDPPADDPSADEPADSSGIEAQLEDKINEYKRLRDSGALWQSIPDTEFNRTAVSAFIYFLTDMKVATIWGVDEAQVQEYEARMAMLEERLLAQQPLGDDIKITLEDKVFSYNGETGEGGYTAK